MTSRVLGLVRDQVLAYFFGAGDAMDAFRIAFRLPNVLRDLFAEGALSAALVPTFTRALATGDRTAAWRLASNVITVLLLISGAVVVAGIVFAEPLVRAVRRRISRACPGRLELTIRLTRIMFPFLAMVATAAVMMAMLNALHRFFIPALSPAMFNVATIVCAVIAVPLSPHLGIEPIVAIAAGTLVGGLGQILAAMAGAAARRVSVSAGARRARSVAARDRPPDGARRCRARGRADQSVRQQLARGRARHRRRVVARLRVPPDVHADRPVRHLHRDGIAARRSPATRRTATIPASGSARVERSAHDVDAERSCHDRPARAGDADRPLDLRARAIYRRRHRGHRRGARVLRAWPDRIFGGQAGLACRSTRSATAGFRSSRAPRASRSTSRSIWFSFARSVIAASRWARRRRRC